MNPGSSTKAPLYRRLKVFAFDPSLDLQLETARINRVTVSVPWEKLEPGPVGEYLEVVDVDPASDRYYLPVDLEDVALIAQDGLDPSERDPRFHQQMVYAVAMRTIRNFELALGRCALWSPREHGDGQKDEYVGKLRIYPHALREPNAYYSSQKKALLFGYFPATADARGSHMPGETVFTCLSHDVVAHETTHALLDGMHRRFAEASNPDALALHEAIADIVALFQHFSLREVLEHQIAQTRGDLTLENLLAKLAQQFGQAIGRSGALRDSIGDYDRETDSWKPKKPDPADLEDANEPHTRGAILVAAVFDAFLAIYQTRVADLLRIASGGLGVMPEGALHPDLVGRLASEAAKAAGHVLRMSIRALDYCPPVDADFGDYLRALITADADLVPNETYGYRIAFINAFRRRGIYPRKVRSLSVENLRWRPPSVEENKIFTQLVAALPDGSGMAPEWNLSSDREEVYGLTEKRREKLTEWLNKHRSIAFAPVAGVELGEDAPQTIERDASGLPAFEVHSVRPSHRIAPDGGAITDLIVEVTQRRRGYFDRRTQARAEDGRIPKGEPDFWFRGGCTLLFDLTTGAVRYCVMKDIASESRLDRQRRWLSEPEEGDLAATSKGASGATYGSSLAAAYFENPKRNRDREPFAMLHRSFDQKEAG